MSFKIAIIGRPNVGKSTLFNRLAGKKLAIVHDMPGVTRDRRENKGKLFDIKFEIIDTAGLEEAETGSLEHGMWQQTQKALEQADIGLMLIDSRAGVTPLDQHFAKIFRKSEKPVILVGNKCEGSAGEDGLFEAFSLGLGEPVGISAEHNLGMADLYDAIKPHYDEYKEYEKQEKKKAKQELAENTITNLKEDEEKTEKKDDRQDDGDIYKRPLKLAIIGRPNVGKSTLVNALLNDERMLTGELAGVTRDSIAVDWEWQGKKIELVDTAGIRRNSRIKQSLERMSVASSKRSAFLAQVVILVLDADAVLEKQDLTLARKVIEEGRALIIAVNKWDAAKDKQASLNRLRDKLQTSLTQVQGIPYITISALERKGLGKLMSKVFDLYEKWNFRVPTSGLNRWFEDMMENHPPPLGKRARRIKLRYITQAKTRPPSFYIFSSNPEGLPESYTRYLINGIRTDFDLQGVPIRLTYRKTENPYAKKKK